MSEMRRDSFNLFNNDHLAVLFDTFHDHRNGFGFAANRLGGMFDWTATNEQPSPNWNGLWASQGTRRRRRLDHRDADPVPVDPLQGRQRRLGDQLPAHGALEERDLLPERGATVVGPARPEQAVERRHSWSGSRRRRRASTSTSSRTRSARCSTNTLATPALRNVLDANFGGDAKWGITQQLVADFTYNTDFAQVEDDEAQVNLTRFSLFFPEKRDFFLEGQDVVRLRRRRRRRRRWGRWRGRRRRGRRGRRQQRRRQPARATSRRSSSTAAASA